MRKLLFFLLIITAIQVNAQTDEFHLPSVISDHAVFQQSSEVKLWGWCPIVWTVKVVGSWNPSDTVYATPGRNCNWEAMIKTPKAGGPYSIRFYGYQNKLVREINDVVFGEVWLCSGQSNMEFKTQWDIANTTSTLVPRSNKEIRFFHVPDAYNNYPQKDCVGEWQVCDEKAAADFSCIGYYFGRKLNEELNVPVGMIGSYWGGTAIQPWMPKESFQKDTSLNTVAERILPKWTPVAQSVMFNAMINPVAKYKIAGVLWYQGEANAVDRKGSTEKSDDYGKLFCAMIHGWREVFHTDFPFYFVQIAPWNGYENLDGALLREQQNLTLSVPRTGMVVVGDLVQDVKNLHPGGKQEIANRLANVALKEQYGKEDIQPYFPRFANLKINGNKAIVTVASIGKLSYTEKGIKNFQIAGENRIFYPAKASLVKDGSIVLIAKEVKNPVAVRYCFTNDGVPNLFDVNKLPLVPFRTDNW
jgi:sialate O-acetylesterase